MPQPSNFNLNSLKGRLAEQLVQDLFLQSNYNVFNYGMERIMPGFAKYLSANNRSKVNKALRFMPDFVVQSMETGDLFYLEVKFRANGKYSVKELPDDYPYKNAWFVIVSPNKIQCIHYNSLAKDFAIGPKTIYSLLGVKSFHIQPELIAEYEKHSAILFAGFKS